MILGLLRFLKGDGKIPQEESAASPGDLSKESLSGVAHGEKGVAKQSQHPPVDDADGELPTARHRKLRTPLKSDQGNLSDGNAIRVDLNDEDSSDVVSVHFDTFVNAEEVSVRTSDGLGEMGKPRPVPVAKSTAKMDGFEYTEGVTKEMSYAGHNNVGYETFEGETAKLGSEELALLVSQYSPAAASDEQEKPKDNIPSSDKSVQLALESGFAHWQRGNVSDALRHFEAAVGFGERVALGYFMIGLCYLQQKNVWEAIKHFKFGLHEDGISNDETLALYFEIGRSYEKIDDMNEANYYYGKIARIDPEFRNDETRFEYGDRLRNRLIGERKQDATIVQRHASGGSVKSSRAGGGIWAFFKKMRF